MTAFDLTRADLRILECSSCHEPVSGEAGSPTLSLRCGYCGFEDVRAPHAPQGTSNEAPYRGKRQREAKRLRIDLSAPLDGISPKLTLEETRTLRLAAQQTLRDGVPDEARIDAEFRLLWLTTWQAAHQIAKRDFLHARAALETALESLSIPAYHALIASRLARLAALSHAQELGERWLAHAATNTAVAEVDSDLRVARALLAHARGDDKEVLEIIGERDTADEFVGSARWFAVALRVDAHEKLGDLRLASTVWRIASKGNARQLQGVAQQYGLAVRTRQRMLQIGFAALAILGLLFASALGLFIALLHDRPVPTWCTIGLAVAIVATFALKIVRRHLG